MTHASTTPTIWFKNQRVWRTLFSSIITGVVVAPQLLAIIGQSWPSETLTLVLGQSVLMQATITRIMAIEKVNIWLSYIGLGSAPRAELLKS